MRALLSVSDKEQIDYFAKALVELGVEIISTGGTARHLKEKGIPVREVSEITGFPECLDGRVKTLHPSIHGGLLGRRNNPVHKEQMATLGIESIDILAVNLYPFKETITKERVTLEEAIENIDIGGPAMLRSAAKNNENVIVLVDPNDYVRIIEVFKTEKEAPKELKQELAVKAFQHTAAYDALIADFLSKRLGIQGYPEKLTLTLEKVQDMRYGENPHQTAAFYKNPIVFPGELPTTVQLNGKELSFNNINDTNGALELLKEYKEPTVIACKHANPCGVASGKSAKEAYLKAYQSDPVSIFGGIVVTNRFVDLEFVKAIGNTFLEIIGAPDYTDEALKMLKEKKNLRVLAIENMDKVSGVENMDMKRVNGGMLVQDKDDKLLSEQGVEVVTKRKPSTEEMEELLFAWKVVKHIKSNGIVITKNKQTIGIGTGQVSRIWACQQAIDHGKGYFGEASLSGACLASDAFFPFADSIEEAKKAGITAIVQPGGSIRDEEVIQACDDAGIAMIFTGMRHFKH